MSTFYVLPPRPLPARPFAEFLAAVLPGLDVRRVTWGDLGDSLSALLGAGGDAYLLHREDLPEGEDAAVALADGFGAAAGDEVVEVGAPGTALRRWRLGQAA